MAERRQIPTSVDEVAAALRAEVEAMSDEFDADRKRLCREWVDFEVATTHPLSCGLNYTLVPVDFYERLARAALQSVGSCAGVPTKCNATPEVTPQVAQQVAPEAAQPGPYIPSARATNTVVTVGAGEPSGYAGELRVYAGPSDRDDAAGGQPGAELSSAGCGGCC